MATDVRTPAANVWNVNNTAESRPAFQAIHDALAAVGLVQTADTGQINISTIPTTGTQDFSLGYEIWRFNDALQSTAPVFIKVEYGTRANVGGGAWVAPALFLSTGQGTNGAGGLTGVGLTRTQIAGDGSGNGGLANLPIWTSGAANRVGMCLQRIGTMQTIGNWFWAIERTKDAAGNDTNEGVHMVTRSGVNGASAGPWYTAQTVITGIAASQTRGEGPMCITNNDGTATDAGNTGIFPWQMCSKRGNENPPLGWASYFYGDLNGGNDIIVSFYGSNHTYRTLGANAGQTNLMGAQRAGWRPAATSTLTPHDSVHFAMRWE